MHKLRAQLKAARSMPPRLIAAKLLRRIGIRTPGVRRAEVLGNPQAQEYDRLAKLYLSFERVAVTNGRQPIDFERARVLEVGCGPLVGLAPFVVPAGAAAYLGVDPGVNPRLLRHRSTVRRYLQPALNASAPMTPKGSQADASVENLLGKVSLFAGDLVDLENEPYEPFTVAVSISCLEHIDELGIELGVLRQKLAPDARQLHLVNFSNHLDKAAPFKHLYDIHPDEHRRRYGKHINLMRPREVLAAFAACGFEARLLPVDVRPEAVPETLHPWWREHYGRQELAIRTALIVV
jgi:SAM-dependent methyltransferase